MFPSEDSRSSTYSDHHLYSTPLVMSRSSPLLVIQLNGMHAFMRDEGYRYDPQLEMFTMQYAINMFHRKLHDGDTKAQAPSEKGTLNAKM